MEGWPAEKHTAEATFGMPMVDGYESTPSESTNQLAPTGARWNQRIQIKSLHMGALASHLSRENGTGA